MQEKNSPVEHNRGVLQSKDKCGMKRKYLLTVWKEYQMRCCL